MDPAKEHSRRHRILAQAQRLMLERGFAATSVNDICKAAEVTKGAFFHHFASKEAMTREVFERFAESILVPMAFARDPHSNRDPMMRFRQLLRIIARTYVKSDVDRSDVSCLIGMFVHEFGCIDSSLQVLCAEALTKLRNAFADELKVAFAFHRSGVESPEDGQFVRLAGFFVGSIQGAIVMARATSEPRLVEDACADVVARAEDFIDHFEPGVRRFS
jgi:TetR/AcrR family transcriptional repressor of nem operon